jgi:hypothetical protein
MNSRTTRAVTRSAVVAGLLSAMCGVLGTQAASAVPVSTTLTYMCNFPLLLPQPLSLTINSDIPATQPLNTLTNSFAINATANVNAEAAFGLNAVGAVSVEGTATAAVSLVLPTGTVLPLQIPTTIPTTPIPASGGFTTTATGTTPQLTFSKPGNVKINVGDLVLTLTPRLVDGTPTGLDTFETECHQDAGQNNTLATINVPSTDTTPPTAPGAVVGTPAPTSVALSWGPSTDDTAVTGYNVYENGVKVQTVTGPTATISGLTPSTKYAFKVQAFDAAGNLSPFSGETSVTTSPDSTATANYSYNLAGTSTLKTLTKGTVPLTGTSNISLTRATGQFTGDLAINPATAKLTALGFLPVTAQVQIAPTAPVTGSIVSSALKANALVRIKLPSISVLGIPLAGGTNCQASQISSISLTSTGAFDPAAGGTIAGTFAISNLSGCGFLNGIVSPLTSGSGNAIALKLSPQAAA